MKTLGIILVSILLLASFLDYTEERNKQMLLQHHLDQGCQVGYDYDGNLLKACPSPDGSWTIDTLEHAR